MNENKYRSITDLPLQKADDDRLQLEKTPEYPYPAAIKISTGDSPVIFFVISNICQWY